MPDPWGTNPDNIFSAPRDPLGRSHSGHENVSSEMKFKDDRGRLRLPAYILIALVIALAAILLVVAGLLLAPG